MESAVLFFMASSLGVMFGWQPMPDGSPRYEYVVQLDPELVASLEEGQSVPITSDIPEEIQPIGRIRIVVGRETLPRIPLTTLLKPSDTVLGKKSREGLIETQHRVSPVQATSPAGRYSNTSSQAILPPNATPPSNNQSFAQSLQNAAQSVGNGSAILPPQDTQGLAGSIQNTTQQLGNQIRSVGESVRTDAQQMFGQVGNNAIGHAVSGVTGQVGKTVEQLQQGFQQSVQPLGQAAQRTGQQIRNTVEGFGQKTRETLDQFGRPLRDASLFNAGQNNSQTILPPTSTPPQPNFATGQGNPRGPRVDRPVGGQRDNWQVSPENHSTPITPPKDSQLGTQPGSHQTVTNNGSGGFNTPWPARPRGENHNQASQPIQPPAEQPRWPNNPPNNRFDMANNPTKPAPLSNRDGQYHSNESGQRPSGPSFPDKKFPPSSQMASTSSAPGISRDMLNKPADSALQTVGTQASYPVSEPTFSPSSNRPPQASDMGWDNASRQTMSPTTTTNENSSQATFPLILSWVLLTGSGFGNFYLIWSFWDVRSKYRGLVHNARGSGGRY